MIDPLDEYSRRRFLGNTTSGLMGVGLSHLLGMDALKHRGIGIAGLRHGGHFALRDRCDGGGDGSVLPDNAARKHEGSHGKKQRRSHLRTSIEILPLFTRRIKGRVPSP